MTQDSSSELNTLADRIRSYEALYRAGAPAIGDAEFDALLLRYNQLADAAGIPAPERVDARPGDDRSEGFAKVRHRLPMLSLEKAATWPERLIDGADPKTLDIINLQLGREVRKYYAFGQLQIWQERVARELELDANHEFLVVVEPKIDGISVSLTYAGGQLVLAVTRGDGLEGDDITAQVRAAEAVPLTVEAVGRFEVRGELYLPRAAFDAINAALEAAGDEPQANPRNACSGLMKRKDPTALAGLGVRAFIYHIAWAEDLAIPDSHWERTRWLQDRGFQVHAGIQHHTGVDTAYGYCVDYGQLYRNGLDHAIDGMVIKLDDSRLWDRLGATERHPRWAIAYKFPPERRATRLRGITTQVGKTGKLTPVAELDPVLLAGTTVSRASLHHFGEIARKDIRVGDLVLVEKAGEIIPQVLEVVRDQRPANALPVAAPTVCPACATAVTVGSGPDGAVHHRCPNPTCPAQVRARLIHFASRSAMDIRGLGPAVVDQVLAHGLVRSPADLFALTTDQLAPLAMEPDARGSQRTFGPKNAAKLVDGLVASKDRGLAKILTGLSVPRLGEKLAMDLASRFGSWDALLAFARDYLAGDRAAVLTVEKSTLKAIKEERTALGVIPLEGVDADTAGPVFRELTSPAMVALLTGLAAAGLRLDQPKTEVARIDGIAGLTFVLTGAFPGMERKAAEALITAAGGTCSGSVSKKTQVVVAGEDAGSKLTRAQELGIPVWSPVQLLEKLAGRG